MDVLPCGYRGDGTDEGFLALTFRRLKPRETRLVAATAVVLAAAIALRLRATSGPTPGSRARSAAATVDVLPRIDLSRLDARPEDSKAGERDIFEFGRPPASAQEEAPVTAEVAPIPTADLAPTPPAVPTLPPLVLKFIGSLDNSRGIKVAVLLTDKNELLTGKVGEVVANRYKIDKIGFESVDLLDVISGQTRRIPLRAR